MNEMQDNARADALRQAVFAEINEKRVGQIRDNGGDGKLPSWTGRYTVAWRDLITETVDAALDADDPNHEGNLAAFGGMRQVLKDIATYAVAAIEEIDAAEASDRKEADDA